MLTTITPNADGTLDASVAQTAAGQIIRHAVPMLAMVYCRGVWMLADLLSRTQTGYVAHVRKLGYAVPFIADQVLPMGS